MKLIIAACKNGGIGYNNKLPWSKIQGDLLRFKRLTTDKIVVMGRNTWDSLPVKPLPDRLNIVMTKKDIFFTAKKLVALSDINLLSNYPVDDIWIIGGAKLIDSCWHLIDEVHLSKVITQYHCDVFFDMIRLYEEFSLASVEAYSDHTYEIWKRKQ
jgi:dihydrofolate reductase